MISRPKTVMQRVASERKTVMDNTQVAPKTKEEMKARVQLLSDEMDANDEENRMMQTEISGLYAKIDALA